MKCRFAMTNQLVGRSKDRVAEVEDEFRCKGQKDGPEQNKEKANPENQKYQQQHKVTVSEL